MNIKACLVRALFYFFLLNKEAINLKGIETIEIIPSVIGFTAGANTDKIITTTTIDIIL